MQPLAEGKLEDMRNGRVILNAQRELGCEDENRNKQV
jgi:hypothetical protein